MKIKKKVSQEKQKFFNSFDVKWEKSRNEMIKEKWSFT